MTQIAPFQWFPADAPAFDCTNHEFEGIFKVHAMPGWTEMGQYKAL